MVQITLFKYVKVIPKKHKYYCPNCRITFMYPTEKNNRVCEICAKSILQYINKDKDFKRRNREKNKKLEL